MSGGNEATGHSAGSFHGTNKAIDVAGKKFNKLTDDEALKAAKNAGFTHGVYEDFRGTKKDHWHFQIGAGNGLGDKHSLKLTKLKIKSYSSSVKASHYKRTKHNIKPLCRVISFTCHTAILLSLLIRFLPNMNFRMNLRP